MRYIKPDYHDNFICVADKCPDTCCAGWQIMIDEASLERYSAVEGDFGRRLVNSIDWQEGCFYQTDRRCAFLNKENLCDLYTALGSEALCHTCKNYPRHTEEYEGLRELSLSLSCPIAAKIILTQKEFPEFVEYEDDREEELAEEFEDFDYMMFTQLEDARNLVMKHLREEKIALEEKLNLYLQLAEEMQECIIREEYFEIDSVIRQCEERGFQRKDVKKEKETGFSHRVALLQHMLGLERLREEWSGLLAELEDTLYMEGAAHYEACVEKFQVFLQEDEETANCWENIGTQLFVFFLYTYFCGAVYDDWIYSKMALAVESVRFIRELYFMRWVNTGKLQMEDFVELAYRYAREIEHSDMNLNTLEELFMERFDHQII